MRLFIRVLLLISCCTLSNSLISAQLRVGTVYFYPPFVMSDRTGFDPELIRIICQDLKLECTLIPMTFNELYRALDIGAIDIAIGGVSINTNVLSNYIYSIPYVLSKGAFLVAQDSNITSINQLQGGKVGVIKGSRDGDVFYNYLTLQFPGQLKLSNMMAWQISLTT